MHHNDNVTKAEHYRIIIFIIQDGVLFLETQSLYKKVEEAFL